MTAHIADYKVIRADPFRLPVYRETERLRRIESQERSFTFRLPPRAVVRERAIVAFIANPSSDVERIDYEIEINGHSFDMTALGSSVTRGLWRIVGGGVLLEPPADDGEAENNTITFRVLGDIGDIRGDHIKFSDVVLWFQRAVAEAP
jgi:hypothetical protein